MVELDRLISMQESWTLCLQDKWFSLCHNLCDSEHLLPPTDHLCYSADERGSSGEERLPFLLYDKGPKLNVCKGIE